jgi:hypothetical protein
VVLESRTARACSLDFLSMSRCAKENAGAKDDPEHLKPARKEIDTCCAVQQACVVDVLCPMHVECDSDRIRWDGNTNKAGAAGLVVDSLASKARRSVRQPSVSSSPVDRVKGSGGRSDIPRQSVTCSYSLHVTGKLQCRSQSTRNTRSSVSRSDSR